MSRHTSVAVRTGFAVLLASMTADVSHAASAPASGYPFEQYLNIRSAGGGSISPDGTKIAFLTNITGVNQLWMVGAGGGWPDQITFYSDTVRFVRWSPVAETPGRLIFGKDAGGNERTQLFLASGDGSRIEPLTTNPKVIYRFGGWSHDGRRIAYSSNERDEAFFDVYVMDLLTREAARVLAHDGDNAVAAWSPDDRGLVIARANASLDNDLFLLDVGTRALKRLTPHEGSAQYDDVRWPPGEIIYATSDQGRDFMNLVAIDVAAPKATVVEEVPHDVEALVFSNDGRRVLVAVNEGGYTKLSLRDGGIKGRELPVPSVPSGVITGFDFSRDGRLLILRAEGSTDPGDIWLHDLDKGATTRVTRSSLGGIPRESFIEPQLTSYKSFDGLEVPALLYLPRVSREAAAGAPAGPAPLPAVVMVHGGPEGQHRPGFSATNQFFLSRGYAILAPNIRGSTGYGKRFHHLDDVRKREDAINDVASAAAFLKGSGRVDPARIAVMGGSYGGYMTLASLTFHPEIWAAGVDIVGISNFRSFLKNTGAWRVRLRESEYGDPVTDADFLDKVSPLNHVDRIRAPLFVIAGANDPRVPKSEADQIVASLRQRGSPVEYLAFDDEGHGVSKLHNRIKAYTAVADFLDKYLKAGSAAPTQGTSTTR